MWSSSADGNNDLLPVGALDYGIKHNILCLELPVSWLDHHAKPFHMYMF